VVVLSTVQFGMGFFQGFFGSIQQVFSN